MKILNRFYSYLKKDFLLLYKRKKYLYLFILLPLVIASLFLFALNPSEYNLKAGICDLDNTNFSSKSYQSMKGFEPIILNQEDCLNNMIEMIKSKKIDLGLEIPQGFTKNIQELKQSKINVYYDGTDIAFANLLDWKVDQALWPFKREIVNSLNSQLNDKASTARTGIDIILDFSDLSGSTEKRIMQADTDLKKLEELNTEFLVNPIWTSKTSVFIEDLKKEAGIAFIFPILALFIILMLSSTSIIYDKNTGFITRVKSTSSPFTYLIAKITFFTILVLIQFIIIFLLFLAYGASYDLNIIGILKLILFIGIIDTLIGLIIGLISNNEGIAVLFSLMISFPLMLVSGVFFPLQILPRIIQWLSGILPLQYQINASKSVLLFEQNLSNNWIYFAIGLFILTWYLTKKN